MKIFVLLYIIAIILIAEIDRRKIEIDRSALIYGMIISMTYMIYCYIVEASSIYVSVIYLANYAILLAIDTFMLKKYAKDSYIIKLLILLNTIFIFSKLELTIYTILMSIIALGINLLILKIKKKKNGYKKIKINEIPIAFFVGASNVMVLIMMFFITNYCIR